MNRDKKSSKLRSLLKEKRTLVKPSAFNALSAMVIERVGFECCGIAGYGISASLLGKPDVGLTTLTEVVMISRHIASAVGIPVIADADTGYGNAVNVMRTVEEFVRAGVAGIQIEDQVAPKRCGYVAGYQVISVEEMAGKIRAADKIRREIDPDFVIIARCDARGAAGGSLDDVIFRCNAYMEAGADMAFPVASLTEDELTRCVREIQGPIQYIRTPGVTPLLSLSRLNELGVAMVSNFDGALESSTRAMWDYMRSFHDEDVEHVKRFVGASRSHSMGEMNGFIGFPEYRKMEEEFLPAGEFRSRYRGAPASESAH